MKEINEKHSGKCFFKKKNFISKKKQKVKKNFYLKKEISLNYKEKKIILI